jgi:hypothetical protein
MSQQEKPKEAVPFDHLTVSNCYEIAALIEVLVRKGLVTETELLEEITRLKKKPTSTAQQAESSTSSPMPLQLGCRRRRRLGG